ncbi:MFS transporter [Flexibacterium corallicola]|uniref:MFS transporter n=1 Tax=Flexibacterium corallicola TaxID=3037259 RepID=UPI00286F0848|nr:MFS transporter [Pseudovibrio sp. M1P-2-3]
MFGVIFNRTYRHLFLAQVIAQGGTGLATVGLSLLAYELAGKNAGLVLGTALTIKMVAYVGLSPVLSALCVHLPRKKLLVTLDILRASVAAFLPFVSEIWQVYLLIFVLQSASAAYTPALQATIPLVLPKESEYTQALSLSRLSYDLESLLSPGLAALLLMVTSFHGLFVGTMLGFVASALLVVSALVPKSDVPVKKLSWRQLGQGMRVYFATPRLRGALPLFLSVAAGGAMVLVNTVVIVKSELRLSSGDVALALAVFGGGSMTCAFLVPLLLKHFRERTIMLSGALFLSFALLIGAFFSSFRGVLVVWLLMGLGYSAVQTPMGRLLKKSAAAASLPDVFAAQFSLSHLCWLFAYPAAGWLSSAMGMQTSFIILAAASFVGLTLSTFLWPVREVDVLEHSHEGLPEDHPHLREGSHLSGKSHQHAFKIDEYHPHWPKSP